MRSVNNQIVGRMAARIAPLLMGKHKPTYGIFHSPQDVFVLTCVPFPAPLPAPARDEGDTVVVVNAEHIKFTGKKETLKNYYSHSTYHFDHRFEPGNAAKICCPYLLLCACCGADTLVV